MGRHFASIDFAPRADGYPFDSRLGPRGDGGHEGKVGVLGPGESFWCWGMIKIRENEDGCGGGKVKEFLYTGHTLSLVLVLCGLGCVQRLQSFI